MAEQTLTQVVESRVGIPTMYDLKTAAQALRNLGITETKLAELTASGHAPHVFCNGTVLFHIPTLRTWVKNNLFQIQDGMPLNFSLTILSDKATKDDLNPPRPLQALKKKLRGYSHQMIATCVYFLCSGTEIVYVGQTTNLPARIATHMREKKDAFDQVFYIPIPESALSQVEGAFIRALKPRLNRQKLHIKSRETQDPIFYEFSELDRKTIAKFTGVDGFGKPVGPNECVYDLPDNVA